MVRTSWKGKLSVLPRISWNLSCRARIRGSRRSRMETVSWAVIRASAWYGFAPSCTASRESEAQQGCFLDSGKEYPQCMEFTNAIWCCYHSPTDVDAEYLMLIQCRFAVADQTETDPAILTSKCSLEKLSSSAVCGFPSAISINMSANIDLQSIASMTARLEDASRNERSREDNEQEQQGNNLKRKAGDDGGQQRARRNRYVSIAW